MTRVHTPSAPDSGNDTEADDAAPPIKRARSGDDAPAAARDASPAGVSGRERRARAREADCMRRVERAEAQIEVLRRAVETCGESLARLEALLARSAAAAGRLGALAKSQLDELRAEQSSRRRACGTEEWWGDGASDHSPRPLA